MIQRTKSVWKKNKKWMVSIPNHFFFQNFQKRNDRTTFWGKIDGTAFENNKKKIKLFQNKFFFGSPSLPSATAGPPLQLARPWWMSVARQPWSTTVRFVPFSLKTLVLSFLHPSVPPQMFHCRVAIALFFINQLPVFIWKKKKKSQCSL